MHKQQKDNESDLVIEKFRNLNHYIETFKILGPMPPSGRRT